nr:hypothetical protein [Tanacetum cinerariifolium]
MGELVFDCVMPYIQQDLTVVSLVSKKYYDIGFKTRKHLTVHVHFAPDPKRVSRRFPNIESLTLNCYSYGLNTPYNCSIPVFPWIQEIVVNFKRLKSLSIRNMFGSALDLPLLAKNRGVSLSSLEILGCCIDLRSLRLRYNCIPNYYRGGYKPNGKWLHELALCNTVMESLYFDDPFDCYNMSDVTLLAKKCSNSLLSLNIFPRSLINFREVFKHAKKLDHFGYGAIDEDQDYSGGTEDFPLDNGVRAMLMGCKKLERLDMDLCPGALTDVGLGYVGGYGHNLRHLSLSYTGESDVGLLELLKGCPKLSNLKLTGCLFSKKAITTFVFSINQSLRYVWLD